MLRPLFLLLCMTLVASCTFREKGFNRFEDPEMIRIADLKDRRLSDSLYAYFESEHAQYRWQSVLAFGSIQDSAAVDRIAVLLNDPDSTVRNAAAFALGQTPTRESAAVLMEAAKAEKNTWVLATVLEAIGKTADAWSATESDPTTDRGAAWALYRMGLRNKSSSEANERAAAFLARGDNATRFAAAHFFARGATDIGPWYGVISTAALDDSLAEVRMAATLALRKINSDSSFLALETILSSDDDDRVRINALRALTAFPYGRIKQLLFDALGDKNEHLAVAASESILSTATGEAWIELSNIASRIPYWRSQANVYQAALKARDYSGTIDEVKALYTKSENPYQRAALLASLGASPATHTFVHDELMKADTPVVRSAAANALVAMNRSPRFDKALKTIFADLYEKAVATGDPAVIGTVASALGDPALGYRDVFKDIGFLHEAKSRLSLPRDNEALQPLVAAIAYFEKRDAAAVENSYNHPIDWELVRRIPSGARAVIRTSRGHITMRLLVDEAPGSVANFVALASRGYFDRKLVHRVVPNFVVQAGCNRGDGWGSEDYSIRSEFTTRKYTTGSVGMASAGKDTEGTQWFITHSPTPHLDGRYSIFAEVTEGMEVVHLIQVGDEILGIDLPFLNHSPK